MIDILVMLGTIIGNKKYSSCLFNASGPKCVTKEELDCLRKVDRKWNGGIVSKSMTVKRRDGNAGIRYVNCELGSINSMGLPNEGYQFYLDYFQRYFGSGESGEMIFSVSGMTIADSMFMLSEISELGKSLKRCIVVELNLSCPNIVGKPQIGYDFETVSDILWKIRGMNLMFVKFGLKLPPYFDISHYNEMAKILMKNADLISFIVCVNSIGNGMVVDVEKEETVIAPKCGFGGIGGDYILPTALANVRMFYKLFNEDMSGGLLRKGGKGIDIIGVGGVKSGVEAFQHILCGASGVQIGTQLMKEGCGVFERVGKELEEIMRQKGYTCIEDFRGKLKEI